MLPPNQVVCATLTYEGIKNRPLHTPATIRQLHQTANGIVDLNGKEMVLFPCKPKQVINHITSSTLIEANA